jgi:hypothetical protein
LEEATSFVFQLQLEGGSDPLFLGYNLREAPTPQISSYNQKEATTPYVLRLQDLQGKLSTRFINSTLHILLRTKYQYSIEKPQNKYSTP